VLQNLGRHEDAIQQYVIALRGDRAVPSRLIGIGVSLQATGRTVDAKEACHRAIDTGELSPDVAAFADQQIKRMDAGADTPPH